MGKASSRRTWGFPEGLEDKRFAGTVCTGNYKQRVAEIFPEGLDTPNTDIDKLVAQKVDEWQLKMDKNGQDFAMFQKLESEIQTMEKAQECVVKAQALHTSLQKEIEEYCTCIIEIETIKKEQPTDQTAQIAH